MNPKIFQAIVLDAMFGSPPQTRRDTPVANESEDFHDHLKRCSQCANNPFGLCLTGERLIKRDAEKLDGSTVGHPGGQAPNEN